MGRRLTSGAASVALTISALAAMVYAAVGIVRGASRIGDAELAAGERAARVIAAEASRHRDLSSICVTTPGATGRTALDAIRLELRLRYLLYPLPVQANASAGSCDAIVAPPGARSMGRHVAVRTPVGDLLLPDQSQ